MRALITYGWCRTAYVVCESLAKAGFNVSACGDSVLSMTRASRYVDTFDLVPDPFGDELAYAAAVGEIMRRRGANLVVPAHEDFTALQKFRHVLPPEAIVAAPSSEDASEALDKWKLIQRAKRANLPVPETCAPQSLEEAEQVLAQIPLPAIIKPHHGNGGKGVSLIHDRRNGLEEYCRIVDQFRLSGSMLPLIQEYIKGAQFGSCFMAVDGKVHACFVERYLRCKQAGFGTSVLRERAASQEIEEYTARLCKELNWSGVGHLDFIVGGRKTKPYLLEMNPRFWGALNLAVRNGYDFPRALVSWAVSGTMDARSFTASPPVSSLWIAGELMANVEDLKHHRWGELLKSPVRFIRSRCYDDFRMTDPLPLIVELVYYLTGFVRTKGAVNPVRLGMINRSSESTDGGLRTDTFYRRIGKRVFDLMLAVPCLLLLLVPMLAVAGAIFIMSGPPVLFTQERIGRFGRRFRIIKYRSMTRGAEAGGSVTVGDDPRITSIGRILRKWKLDELPQLLNVIWGDMSLVGPRADVPGFMDQLRGLDRLLLGLRPGVTGPATLAYRNEETLLALQGDPQRYNAEVLFPDKVKINKTYLEHLSLRADLGYIFATLAAIVRSGHGQFEAYAPSVKNVPNGFSDPS